MKKRMFMTKNLFLLSLICMFLINNASAQQAFRKPGRKTQNQLTPVGTYLKTMFSFETDKFDTVPQPGMEPAKGSIWSRHEKPMESLKYMTFEI